MDTKQIEPINLKKNIKEQGNSKDDLLAYIKESEQRQNAKLELLERNQSCVKSRPDPEDLAKLDSSLKKNTTFVKKLRNFTANQLDILLKDCAALNLSKYLSEVVSSLTEAKLKFTDIPAAITLCTELNCTYTDFSPIFHEQWIKILCIKKDDAITNPKKLSIDLRFYSELIACGVFSQRESLPLLGTVLTVLTSDKKYLNLSIVISFCKHCGDDFAGLLPQRIRKLSDQFCIPVPCSSLLSVEKQANVRALFKDYYLSLSQHLQKEMRRMEAFEKQNKQLLNTKGELRQDRIIKDEVLHAELQTLTVGAFNLAELLDLPQPDMPESSCCEDSNMFLDAEECVGGSIWEDEETRLFYTKFPDLREYLPQGSKKQNTEEKITKNVFLEVEDINKEEMNNNNKDNTNKEDMKKEDDTSANEEQEGNISKSSLETFLKHLPNCVNKEMVDNAAIEFLLYLNSKFGRKKLIFTLFTVHRTRLDLLPLYGRLVAILNPAIPEIGYNLCQQLKNEVQRHIQKKDQVNIESKIRSIRFVGELVNLQVFSKNEALQLLKMLLRDFSHHHIEMACNLLETCGRFLYRSVESHHRTKAFVEQMMRIKSMTVLDARYVYMIENIYYLVNPPDGVISKSRTKTILHQFIDKIIFQDLMQPGFEATALNLLRSMDWDCENTVDYIIKCLSSPHKIKYQRIRALAGLVAELVEYQEFVGSRIVDGVLEDIRLGMEINLPMMNQRRFAMVKYLGELYTFRLLENADVFKILYSMITFGISMDHDNPSSLDPPFSVFRIRLVIALLDTCALFFSDFCSRQKLNCFFTYFQSYYWFKRTSPIWTRDLKFPQIIDHMFIDSLTSMCPQITPARTYTEAQLAVKKLSDKIISDFVNINKESGELQTFLECSEEEDLSDDSNIAEEVSKTKSTEHLAKQNTSYSKMIEDDMEFLVALDQMFVDNVRLCDRVKHSNVDISIPIAHKKELAEQDSNFVLILKKGNKQQCKSLEIPPDSELVVNLKTREEEERREMEKVKQITLDISQRIQDEAATLVDMPH